MTFNIIKIHIFPENFIEIPQFVQMISRISPSVLAILINFHQCLDFLRFTCYKKSNYAAYRCFNPNNAGLFGGSFSGGGKFDSHPSPLYFKKDLSNNVKQTKYFES